MEDDECIEALGRPISSMKVTDLRDELTKRALIKTGNKKELIDRLRTAIQRESLKQHISGEATDLSINNQSAILAPQQEQPIDLGIATDLSFQKNEQITPVVADMTIHQTLQDVEADEERMLQQQNQQRQLELQQQQQIQLQQLQQQQQHYESVAAQQMKQDDQQSSGAAQHRVDASFSQYSGDSQNLAPCATIDTQPIAGLDPNVSQPSHEESSKTQAAMECDLGQAPPNQGADPLQVHQESSPDNDNIPESNYNNHDGTHGNHDGTHIEAEQKEPKTVQPVATQQEETTADHSVSVDTKSSEKLESVQPNPQNDTCVKSEPKPISLKRGISELRAAGSGRKEKRRKWCSSSKPEPSQGGSDSCSQANLITGGISSQKLQELIGKEAEAKANARMAREEQQQLSKGLASDADPKQGSKKDDNNDIEAEGPQETGTQQELDDLFKKTKSVPHLFWLPLSEDQADERAKIREEREIKERERAQKAKEAREQRELEMAKNRRSPPRRRSPAFRRSPPRHRSPIRRSTSRHRGPSPPRRSPPRRRSPPPRSSPPRRRSPGPMRRSPGQIKRSPGPIRRSPPRRASPPFARRSPGPMRRSPGPPRRGSPGPIRRSPPRRSPPRRSPGPMRRSPGLIRRSPGPIRRSPGPIRRSPGPIRRSPGPTRRSPGPIRRSPGPIRRSPGPIRRASPLRRRSPGPIRRSPMRHSPEPIRRSPGPIRRSPGPIRRSSPRAIRRSPAMLRRSPAPIHGGSPSRGGRSPPRRRSPARRRSPLSITPERKLTYGSDQRRLQRPDRLR